MRTEYARKLFPNAGLPKDGHWTALVVPYMKAQREAGYRGNEWQLMHDSIDRINQLKLVGALFQDGFDSLRDVTTRIFGRRSVQYDQSPSLPATGPKHAA